MQGHIVSVNVDGQDVEDDFDLDAVEQFGVETATGLTYTVQRTSTKRWWPWTWDVLDQHRGLVGTVKRTGYRWSGFDYEFSVPRRPLQGGSQGTLWNAVQSLTR
jgi:hypothetical protein